MAASTDDDEARRLAELIGGDSDSDEEETDADRLRMAQLLGRRGISDEASDDDDAPVVTTPALVPRAPPAPPQLVVLPPEVRSGTKRNPEVGGIGATTAEGPGLAAAARARARAAAAAAAPSGVHGPEPPPPPRRAPPPEPLEPVRAPPVLQHLLECALGPDKALAPCSGRFGYELDGAPTGKSLVDFGFDVPAGKTHAVGYRDGGEVLGRLWFPPFAAGAMGTARGLGEWLCGLSKAHRDRGDGMHAVAQLMLERRKDLGAGAFMGARMGCLLYTSPSPRDRG